MIARAIVAAGWRPEWPVTVVVAIGWVSVIAIQASGGHQLHGAAPLVSWLVMTVLMMVPLTLPAIRHLAFNSFKSRRPRAMTIYLAAYVGAWLLFGALSIALVSALGAAGVTARSLIAATLGIAAAWQLSAYRRRQIVSCRRAPSLPPLGLRADAACARFALAQARHCMIVCWPAMLLMAIVEHRTWLMAALTMIMVAEERTRRRERLFVPIAALSLATAVIIALV